MLHGAWHVVHGKWYMVRGIWYVAQGARNTRAFGTWYRGGTCAWAETMHVCAKRFLAKTATGQRWGAAKHINQTSMRLLEFVLIVLAICGFWKNMFLIWS